MGAIEQRLGEESAAPSALLLPIPVDGGSGDALWFSRQQREVSEKDQGTRHKGIGSNRG